MTHNIWEIGLFRNPWSVGAVIISMSIALISVYVPGINVAMGLAPLNSKLLLIAASAGLVPPIAEEVTKLFLRAKADTPKFA